MSKIESFTIGKGKTLAIISQKAPIVAGTPPQPEEWQKRYLELTVRLPESVTEEGLQDAITRAEITIDNYLNQPITPQIPDLDIAEINELPWRKFEKAAAPGSAKPDHPGWIFKDDMLKLADAITKVGGKLEIGEWTFTLKGTDKTLINRSKRKLEK